jgi:thiol-disulfide isomerase/thioredoxin
MRDLLLTTLTIAALFTVSCTPEESSLMEPGKTVLTGTVVPYDPAGDVEALVVSYEDLNSGETVRHRCPIDSLGRFRLELELPHTIEAFIGAREYHHILLIPNEHIKLVYRGKDGLVVSGSAITEELHQQLHAYTEADEENGPTALFTHEMETLETDTFLQALQNIRERRTAFLEAYHEEHGLHSFLYQWAQNDIYFKYLRQKLSYRLFKPLSQDIQPSTVAFPPQYAAELENFDYHPSYETNMYFHRFLNIHYHYYLTETQHQSSHFNEIRGDVKAVKRYLLEAALATENRTLREALLVRALYSLAESTHIKDADRLALYEEYKAHITNESFLGYLDELYEPYTNSEIAPTNNDGQSIELASEDLKQLLQPYEEKYIYLVSWGTWCGPCMKEIPHYNAFMAKMDTSRIQTLFLASRSPEPRWRSVIEAHNLSGAHHLLTARQTEQLCGELKLCGYPSHALIPPGGTALEVVGGPIDYDLSVNEALLQKMEGLGLLVSTDK